MIEHTCMHFRIISAFHMAQVIKLNDNFKIFKILCFNKTRMTSFLVNIIMASWFNIISRKTFKILGHSLICSFFFFDLFHRLYRSIGEYDILRGIFSSEIGTKQITQDALLAEARSDYSEAARLYNEVELISSKCVSCCTTFVLWMETLPALELRPSNIQLYSLTFTQRLLPKMVS